LSQSEWHRVASAGAIAPGKSLCVEVAGTEILLCHTSEGFFAIDNICSHAHARLSEGRLRGHRVFCPLHSAAFDVRDGRVLSPPATAPVRAYAVRVEGDEVMIDVGS
jgi:naphthalene 1,2-dioxygenase system ferredoxin subunit